MLCTGLPDRHMNTVRKLGRRMTKEQFTAAIQQLPPSPVELNKGAFAVSDLGQHLVIDQQGSMEEQDGNLPKAKAPAGSSTGTRVRTCSVCKQPGHDKRRCPKKVKK